MTGGTYGPRHVALCPPTSAVPEAGSFERPCADCRRPLWVESILVKAVDSGRMAPLCAGCVGLELAVSKGVRIGVLPGQESQFADMGIPASAGQMAVSWDSDSPAYGVLLDALEEVRRDEC